MSEQGASQPSNPAAAMIDAFAAGDKAGAQRLLDERNARSGIEQGEGENNAPTAFPESAPVEQTDSMIEQMRAQPDGERWIAELGGVGTPDFAQNVSLAIAGYERLSRDMPHVIETFTGEIEREDGTIYSPGDDPSLIFHLARYERLLRARGGDALPAPFQAMKDVKMNAGQRQSTSQPPSNVSAEARHADLTEALHLALQRGDKRRANQLQAERERLSRALGDAPIVGTGGRNA